MVEIDSAPVLHFTWQQLKIKNDMYYMCFENTNRREQMRQVAKTNSICGLGISDAFVSIQSL